MAIENDILQQAASASNDDELMPATQVQMPQQAPLYRVLGQAIPVSQSAGKLWAGRKDASQSKMRKLGYYDSWDEAVRYFRNDQSTQRATQSGTRSPFSRRARRNQQIGDDGNGMTQDSENLVFANTSSLVPTLYAKNPIIEVTPAIDDPDNIGQPDPDDNKRQLAVTGKKLVNALLMKMDSPGVNLKPKARKCVIMTTLTNLAYIEVGYTKKEDAQETALSQIQQLAQQLVKAQSPNDIEEIEGQLASLEEEIDILSPAGPSCKVRHPKDVLRDPDSTSSDLSDDNFIMIADYVSTAWLHAKFFDKQGDGDYKSLFQASHVMTGDDTSDANGIQDEINNFAVLKQSDATYKTYGYGSQEAFDSAKRTKVWYVWDKITRRVYMFNDKDWAWPIWVWDDPYKLEGFYPLSCLQFYTDPEECIGPSEVSMYLDQVDAVNQISTELAKMRNRAINMVFYNKRLIQDKSMLDAYLNGNTMKAAVGVDMPLDADLSKAIFSGMPPSAAFDKLFDKSPIYQAIDRMSSVSDVMRGEQFKTNTTNQAINTYNSNTQTRLDEKIDAVEDFIGDIGWKLLQLCFQFMDQDTVAQLIGQKAAASWQQMEPADVVNSFVLNTVGGSTQKPTSAIKKQEALQMAQALGQYGNAGGGAVVLTVLRILERAFDDFVIDRNDWNTITQAIMTNLNRGNNAPGAGGAPPQGDPSQGGGQPAQGQLPPIQGLPQKLQQLIETVATKAKVPLPQAEAMVLQRLQQQQQGGEQ